MFKYVSSTFEAEMLKKNLQPLDVLAKTKVVSFENGELPGLLT